LRNALAHQSSCAPMARRADASSLPLAFA
jgi:hypothetical protein